MRMTRRAFRRGEAIAGGNLEHGAIVFAYDCKDPCPDVVAALTAVRDGMPADPACSGPPGPSVRAVITPDARLTTPIAVAAWGATYTATCIDPPSLRAFAKAHYAHAPENFCADGKNITSAPPCGDAGSNDGGDGGTQDGGDAGSKDGGDAGTADAG